MANILFDRTIIILFIYHSTHSTSVFIEIQTQPPPYLRLFIIIHISNILEQPPHTWTTERLWRAYAQLKRDHVRGINEHRVLADLVSLVRHAVQLDEELLPYPEHVTARYCEWLGRVAEHSGGGLALRRDDLGVGEF